MIHFHMKDTSTVVKRNVKLVKFGVLQSQGHHQNKNHNINTGT